jgi:two-component system sensor histidine kinase PhoQ
MSFLSLRSIRGRLTIASLILLPLICGLLAWSLDKAYSSSLMQGQQRQMMLQAYALIAAAEIEESALWLPEQMTDDRLNQLSSDTFALVVATHPKSVGAGSDAVWQSLSASDKLSGFDWSKKPLKAGEHLFSSKLVAMDDYFVLQYAVEWEGDNGALFPFQFVVFENSAANNKQLSEYRHTLWWWLGATALSLIVLQILMLRWGLKPISGLIDDLSSVQQGEADSLSGCYPQELTVMTDSINQLLKHELKQRERYRHTLADLAHSIKNPAAIVSSTLDQARKHIEPQNLTELSWLTDIAEQNDRINQIVSYQLTRAVSGSAAPFNKAILVKPICEKIVSALKKVYADKSMVVKMDLADKASFRGDEGDLMELLGNLIDNAFKYGKSEIHVLVKYASDALNIVIEDDGLGMTSVEKRQLVGRGERADTAMPGQGIGLAVVNDIVGSYQGELLLTDSSLNGLKIGLTFRFRS